jgi:methionyl aminopeptidase
MVWGGICMKEPQVPNIGKRRKGEKIKEGIVLAIEPMINFGTKDVRSLEDGWTIIAKDRRPSAHFEHDVAFIDGKYEILSSFEYVEEALKRREMVIV